MKKAILLICFVILTISLSGCIEELASPAEPTQKETELLACSNISEQAPSDNCFLELAQEYSDIAICDKVILISKRESCYNHLALESKNRAYCEKIITDKDLQERCLFDLGFKEEIIQKCKGYPTNQQINLCIREAARNTKDPTLCEHYIEYTDTSAIIHMYVPKGSCYYLYAIAQEDSAVCDQLADKFELARSLDAEAISKEEMVSNCKRVVRTNTADEAKDQENFDKAVSEMDESYCEEIDSSALRSKCYGELAKVKEDLALCGNTIGPDSCKLGVLQTTRDIGGCEGVSDDFDLKSICLAILTPDISKCDQLANRLACILRYAEANEDWQVCNKLSSIDRDLCLLSVAEKKKDYSICEQMSNQTLKERCRQPSST